MPKIGLDMPTCRLSKRPGFLAIDQPLRFEDVFRPKVPLYKHITDDIRLLDSNGCQGGKKVAISKRALGNVIESDSGGAYD